jgi:hypothetical protein
LYFVMYTRHIAYTTPHVDLSPDSASRGAVQQCEHTLCANTQDSFTIHMLNDVGVSAAVQLRLYREDTPEWWHGDSDVTMGRFG